MIHWEEDYDLYDRDDLPTDWQHVTSIDSGGGYEWTTFHAFYSSADRRYYWDGGSGCSCNSWGDDLYHVGDFQSGNKVDLQRAIWSFAGEHFVGASEALDASAAVRRFRGCDE